jgi:predicted short-subunit dehydrogenase-like oxidoreductase (DUF2520 family)
MTELKSVCIIGAGNVAHHLGLGLSDAGIEIRGVYSKTFENASKLAQNLRSEAFHSISDLPASDLFLLCVKDDVIASVLKRINEKQALAYTSGSVEISNFEKREQIGVFYPLQTFSKEQSLELFEVPFLIEANSLDFAQALFDLAWKLSRNVQFANSEQRKQIHIAAVFLNNFTNHIIYLAQNHLQKNNLDMELLKPLLKETISKVLKLNPLEAQTGPARRNDQHVIDSHLAQLDGRTKEIYRLLTESIQALYKAN